jgi:LmbE family N-acetylglucosaminyl deacetylase
VTRRRIPFSRPPIGAVWGWAQTVAGRTATDSLLPGSALVLSPHEDDETIGCGLLMAEKRNRGIPVAVAVATDGRAGWYAARPRPSPQEIAEIRHNEWHRALDVLGIPPADRFEFNLPDGGLSDHEDELARDIGGLLRRVRPSQIFVTGASDPHPDHRTLARTVGRVVHQVYGSGSDVPKGETADGSPDRSMGPRPQMISYRVYPGAGIWPSGRPSQASAVATVVRCIRSVLGLPRRRALLVRAPHSAATKAAAIGAYESQSRLLQGELRYVWDTDVELYWPTDGVM